MKTENREKEDAGLMVAWSHAQYAGERERVREKTQKPLLQQIYKRVLEERALDSRIEVTLREVLGIAKREFHDSIVDLVKRKRLATESDSEIPVEVRAVLLDEIAVEDKLAESHYTNPHWARATIETLVRIGNLKEPVGALIDHGSEINLMSMDFYKKGNWPINTKHGWKIRAATRATEELARMSG